MKPDITSPKRNGRPLSFDRQAILEQAMLTFWRHGYETTSISDLTAAMGVTAPSLYMAFGDKKRLFLEAMRLYAGAPEALQTTLFDAPTAREAAYTMLIASARAFTGETTPRGCLLASATASGSKDSADVQAAVSDIRAAIIDTLRRRVEQDIALGLLPRETPALSLASLAVALVQGMSVLARDGVERGQLESMVEALMDAWPK